MEKYYILIVGLFMLSCSAEKHTVRKNKKEFQSYLNKLDSAAKVYRGDTIPCCSVSIAYMVMHTDVKISAEPTHFGFMFYTGDELRQWHEWYNKKYSKKGGKK